MSDRPDRNVWQTTSSKIGTSETVAILGAFAVQLTQGFAPNSEASYFVMFAVTAVLTAIALVASLILKRKPSAPGRRRRCFCGRH